MTKNLITYKASAGSGKTYTLSLEYISLCLKSENPWNFTRILAITFTNKAASELKHRVLQYLKDIYSGDISEDFMTRLIGNTGANEDQLKERAKRCYDLMMFNYSDIHISTIDSFVLSIVKSFSLELGLAFDFTTELDVDRVQGIIVQEILSLVGRDKEISENLVSYAKNKLSEGKSWRLGRQLKKAVNELMQEDSIEARTGLGELTPEELKESLDEVEQRMNRLYQEIRATQNEALDLLLENGLEIKDLAGGSNGFGSIFKKERDKLDEKSATPIQLEKIYEEDLSSSSAKKSGKDALVNKIADKLRECFLKVCELNDKRRSLAAILRNKILILLAQRVQDELDKLEETEGIGLLQNNNARVSRIVRNNPTPFIYERVGERIHHFLIDEFQDTSVLQWKNMIPLIENSLSYGRSNFIVGDAKQSIYRFRSGEMEQIIMLPDIYEKGDDEVLEMAERTFNDNHHGIPLKDNFRSAKTIVEFNNQLFKRLKECLATPYRKAYDDVSQNVQRTEVSGYVAINLMEEEHELEDALPKLLDQINECIEDGYRGSDIAVLVRTKKEGKLIAPFLEQKGHKIASEEQLLLKRHPEVLFLISMLQVIAGTKFHKPYLFIIRHLIDKHGLESDHTSWLQDYQKNPGKWQIDKILESLKKSIDWARYENKDAFYCIEYLTRHFNLDDRDPYLQELQNKALKIKNDTGSSLTAFLEFWEEKKDKLSLKMSPTKDRIQLMTIHKAKGLEFPVVMIPLLKWGKKKTHDERWIKWNEAGPPYALITLNDKLPGPLIELNNKESQKSNMDQLNLLYVALTRPQERLYCNIFPKSAGLTKEMYSYIDNLTETSSLRLGVRSAKSSEKISDEGTATPLMSITRADRERLLKITASDHQRFLEEREFGDMVHHILEKSNIETTEGRERIQVADRFRNNPRWTEAENIVKDVIELESEQGWPKDYPVVRSEVEILDSEGKLHRIDKLYLNEKTKKAIVLDYKTGKPSEDQNKQMSRYMDLISEMGFECEGYLLFTSTRELKQV